MGDDRPDTVKQEVRRLRWIVSHMRRLSPAGIRYLRSLLNDTKQFDA